MTDKQGEILYRLKMSINIPLNGGSTIIIDKEDIETVLNMIKEKDAEIEKLKRDFKIVDQECSRLEKKEAKQDKIIDLMAEHIVSSAIVDDTVCALKCDCETDILEDCTHDKMLKCTKQYFEQEATNDV